MRRKGALILWSELKKKKNFNFIKFPKIIPFSYNHHPSHQNMHGLYVISVGNEELYHSLQCMQFGTVLKIFCNS